MYAFIQTGHTRTCHAQNSRCICEKNQYLFTGTLALLVGIIQAFFGFQMSMTLFSDALHAFPDAFADFFGAYTVSKIEDTPEKETYLRKRASKVVALLLVGGAVWIGIEAASRYFQGGHTVATKYSFFVALAAMCIHFLRWRVLTNAQIAYPTDTRSDLIVHAWSDIVHSASVTIVFVLFRVVEDIGIGSHWIVDVDLLLSELLSLYMLKLSHDIWIGEHHH